MSYVTAKSHDRSYDVEENRISESEPVMGSVVSIGPPQESCRRLTCVLLISLAICGTAAAQTTAPPGAPRASLQEDKPTAPSASLSAKRGCVELQSDFTGLEYHGPFKKAVNSVIGKPDIKTVEQPHVHGEQVCQLPVRKKFNLFVRDTFEPVTFMVAGFNAGIAQAADDDPTFGQGAQGYGKRYGAALADQVSAEFWGTFFYPTLTREDPRYYRRGTGSTGRRLFHTFEHAFITHRDNGNHTFNFSEWMSATTTTALGNLYHPGNSRGFQPAARGVAYSVAYDVGFDILREFWPEITGHVKVPFFRPENPPPEQKK